MLSRRINGTGVPAVTTDFQFAASQVPIECVKTVTAAATQAVKTIECLRSNAVLADDLHRLICSLMLTVLKPMSGMTQIAPDLEDLIERLRNDLNEIHEELRLFLPSSGNSSKLKFRARFKGVVYRSDIGTKLSECKSKLDWAIALFEVEGASRPNEDAARPDTPTSGILMYNRHGMSTPSPSSSVGALAPRIFMPQPPPTRNPDYQFQLQSQSSGSDYHDQPY